MKAFFSSLTETGKCFESKDSLLGQRSLSTVNTVTVLCALF